MVKIEAAKCTGCGGCVNLCPDAAMSLSSKDVIAVDEKLCSKCQICVKVCPVRALSM
jgi:ferredoxin